MRAIEVRCARVYYVIMQIRRHYGRPPKKKKKKLLDNERVRAGARSRDLEGATER